LVKDKHIREQLKEAAHDQTQVTDASLLIVICADAKAWGKKPLRYWPNVPAEVQSYMETAIDAYYRDKEQV